MPSQSIFIISALVVSIAFAPVRAQTTEWKLSKAGNDIKVYTRQSEGSKIKESRAIITVTANMKSLENLIENVSDYPNWQANITTVKILKQVNKTEQYIYYTTDVPWPITDRDIVMYSKKIVNADGTITYNYVSKPDYIEEKKDFVRIKDAKSMWQFTPQGKNKIEVICQFYGDPAGNIPNWIINIFIVDSPYTTLTNLKKKVEKIN